MIGMSQIATVRQRYRWGVLKMARRAAFRAEAVRKRTGAADLFPELPVRLRRGRILDLFHDVSSPKVGWPVPPRACDTHITRPWRRAPGRSLSVVRPRPGRAGGNTPRAFWRGRGEGPSARGRPAARQGRPHRSFLAMEDKESRPYWTALTVMGELERLGTDARCYNAYLLCVWQSNSRQFGM